MSKRILNTKTFFCDVHTNERRHIMRNQGLPVCSPAGHGKQRTSSTNKKNSYHTGTTNLRQPEVSNHSRVCTQKAGWILGYDWTWLDAAESDGLAKEAGLFIGVDRLTSTGLATGDVRSLNSKRAFLSAVSVSFVIRSSRHLCSFNSQVCRTNSPRLQF